MIETKIILRGKAVYKGFLEGKKYSFKKGVPVIMHPTYAAIFGQKRDENKKFLFEIIHGESPQLVSGRTEKSKEAIEIAVKHKQYMKTRTTLGASRRFGYRQAPSRI